MQYELNMKAIKGKMTYFYDIFTLYSMKHRISPSIYIDVI